ncbi:MAG: hypothetical protein ACE5EA_10685 [Nitrospirota bacterium]
MYIDPVLKEKWIVQQKLAKKADYKIENLTKNAHENVLKLMEKMGVDLKYSEKKGSYLKY